MIICFFLSMAGSYVLHCKVSPKQIAYSLVIYNNLVMRVYACLSCKHGLLVNNYCSSIPKNPVNAFITCHHCDPRLLVFICIYSLPSLCSTSARFQMCMLVSVAIMHFFSSLKTGRTTSDNTLNYIDTT
jgi:hypothetical protein